MMPGAGHTFHAQESIALPPACRREFCFERMGMRGMPAAGPGRASANLQLGKGAPEAVPALAGVEDLEPD